jgi:hypothetical protein
MVPISLMVAACLLVWAGWRLLPDRRAVLLRLARALWLAVVRGAGAGPWVYGPLAGTVAEFTPTFTPTDASRQEAALVARLLTGELDRATYRWEMAELAAEDAALHPMEMPSDSDGTGT